MALNPTYIVPSSFGDGSVLNASSGRGDEGMLIPNARYLEMII
jgi:hypothetical protein